MGVRRGIDRKKVGCRSLIDAYLEGQVGVNKFKLYECVLSFVVTVLYALFVLKYIYLFDLKKIYHVYSCQILHGKR